MKKLTLLAAAFAATFPITSLADDGPIFLKNISKTPDLENEFADVKMMRFYVPAQSSDGTLITAGIDYLKEDATTGDTSVVFNRKQAKPLVAAYTDGHVDAVGDLAFIGFGQRDVYGAISLDDGATWKTSNLSQSGETAISFTGNPGQTYYGDVIAQFSGVSGNKILIAWPSRACTGGNPAYLLADGTTINPWTGLPYADEFGVQGTQSSVDYAEEDDAAVQAVGVVPFSCVWTVRGTIAQATDGTSKVIWRKPERLTSGRRDANRIEVGMAEDGGFVVTWQEDPKGTLPGQGEGPGEGWSGATVNHQTDIWYSYIPWTHFDAADANGDGVADSTATLLTTTEKPAVVTRMSIPVRITDNVQCTPDSTLPFCLGMDANTNGVTDLCASTRTYLDSKGKEKEACVAEDGRVFQGQTGASRARVNMQPYTNTKGTTSTTDDVKSAWVTLIYEESKGLGEVDLDGDGKGDEIGKNIRYQSFDMFNPGLFKQGLELNAPTTAWACVTNQRDPNLVYDAACHIDWNASVKLAGTNLITDAILYDTEIARRGALMTQGVSATTSSANKISAVTIFKQGILNQGGPADVMIRRFKLPANFNAGTMNPFDANNMVCDNWAFQNGSNPYYLDGLCLTPATNLSAVTPGDCADTTLGTNCGYGVVNPEDQTLFPKVYNWTQTAGNLNDESWENAYDVAKGHRGFLSGDFIMAMYAWSPNWKLNAKGQDVYNLYVRRSFDGGATWTTTPAALGGTGTETCEIYRDAAGGLTGSICTSNAAGAFEPARNMSMQSTLKKTVLDPRFTPTGGLLKYSSTAFKLSGESIVAQPAYLDDKRDPSKFFIAYEDGDNETVAAGGEAEPMDLFYSRATVWGDVYSTVLNTNGTTGFDWLENKEDTHASEAALMANPAGTFLYSIWSQWEYDLNGDIVNSDSTFRRVFFDDASYAYDLDGDGDIDNADLAIIKLSLKKCTGQAGYNPAADFDQNGCVTLVDYQMWLKAYKAQ